MNRPAPNHLLLPDFCAPRAVLVVLLIVTLTALLLTLSSAGFGTQFWLELARNLLFLVWTGLLGAGLLCLLRRQIAARSAMVGAVLVIGVIALLVAAVSEIAWRVMTSPSLNPGSVLGEAPPTRLWLLARNVLMGSVITALALRYFYVSQQWRLNIEAQALSRVNALQARIRPHFLYNSMNTIAALTRSDPARAEEAVQDLADLFRANLNEKRSMITLKEELEAARIYQRIEQQRLGERLKVRWNVAELPMRALVPALTLQPLLENAIGHGIENLPGGGEVIVEGDSAEGVLRLSVRNPLPSGSLEGGSGGNGIALDNIRERLALLYGERSSVSAGREGDQFVVQLRFPVKEGAREALHEGAWGRPEC
jgi:two-component system, LytTR family, sensor histidine kinase AlgZ